MTNSIAPPSNKTVSDHLKNYLVAAAIGDLEFLKYSIESGRIGVNETYNGKPTALSYACMRAQVPIIEFLLEQGANVNHLDKMGETPLHYAAISKCPLAVNHLLDHGATPNVRDNLGRSPLSISADKEGCTMCLELLMRYTSSQPQYSSARH